MYINEPFEPKIFKHYFQDSNILKAVNKPICILGVPDLTYLGTNCVEYLIQGLKAEKFVTYYFSGFEPITFIEKQDQIAELINIEFYLVNKFEKRDDLVIIKGNGIPISSIGINFLAERIAEFVSSLKPQLFISIGSILTSHPTQIPRTFLAHTSDALLQIFKIDPKTHQNKSLNLELFQNGILMGLNGSSIAYAKDLYNIIGGILLSETVRSQKTDYTAVKAILIVLNTIFNLQLSFKSLNSDIMQFSQVKKEKPSSEAAFLKRARKRIQT